MSIFGNDDDTKFVGEALGLINRAIDIAAGGGRYDSQDEPIPGCGGTLTGSQAEELRQALRRETWDEQKHDLLAISLRGRKVTCVQARCLVKTFTFDKGDAGVWLVKNNKISDPWNMGEMVRGLLMWDREAILKAAR